MSTPLSRRDLLRGGRDLAALLSLSTLAGTETPLVVGSAEAAQNASRAAADVYRAVGVKPCHQRAWHVHDHQRLVDASRSAGGDGRGGAAVRPSR
jgi:hypothetical protein